MKRIHFETLKPICPACRQQQIGEFPLAIGWVATEDEGAIREGALECSNPDCRLEYPIIDGLPILVPDARSYLEGQMFHFLLRTDLDPRIESLLGECAGPGSALDLTRFHLSSYAWDHYGEFSDADDGFVAASKTVDPEGSPLPAQTLPGSIVRAWRRIRDLAPPAAGGPLIDIGCSVGRIAFEMAEEASELVLGVDLNASMLRLAQSALRSGRVSFPVRRSGLLYDPCTCSLPFRRRDLVDFWVADGSALPFPQGTFQRSVALNVVDSAASPLDLLRSLRECTRVGGHMVLAAPYDWSSGVTPPAAWIGGHSPRAPGGGSSSSLLRALLTPGAHPVSLERVRVVGELEGVPWTVRMHDRASSSYSLHAIAAEVQA